MKILVIDGQGGGLGRQLVAGIKEACPKAEIIAVGTNALATNTMLKAGADHGATGENAVVVNCRKADIIVGPTGIVIADSMYGEITPTMAVAIGQSEARRILVPVNLCDSFIAGTPEQPMLKLVQDAISLVKTQQLKIWQEAG
nr:DUF3842 family protein [uncultured Oscillibacter sp.]